MEVTERDSFSGRKTTGHVWNGIKELDTPVPRGVLMFLIVSNITLGVSTSIMQTSGLLSAVISEQFVALLVDAGFNFWPVFEPARQKDKPRSGWFWADYLHYIRTGQFTRQLLYNARLTDDNKLIAYAYGYLSHYVTDVVGHPYVNQVVQAPWRLYWQRHHLVENFIDGYVWDRWHSPQAGNPSDPEPPLDKVTTTPNVLGAGAPYSYARLNDHVNVGKLSLGDPVDAIVQQIAGMPSVGSPLNIIWNGPSFAISSARYCAV